MYLKLSVLLALTLFVCPSSASAALPAFPDCQGYGCTTTCGAGPSRGSATNVCKVTNLNGGVVNDGSCGSACYSGSLAYCLTVPSPITIVFEVSGVIPVKGELSVNKPYTTIAGETAPAPGIALRQARLVVTASDVCMRHISLWAGGESGRPSCNVRDNLLLSGSRAAFSNMELAFGVDENVDLYLSPKNVTIQNSIIAKGLLLSCHQDDTGNLQPHSMGIRIDDNADLISIHHNLLSSNNQRNPRTKANRMQWIGNVVYNWGEISGQQSSASGKINYDWMSNYYKEGPDSIDRYLGFRSAPPTQTSRYYITGNLWDDGSRSAADWNRVDKKLGGSSYAAGAAQLNPPFPVSAGDARSIYTKLIVEKGNIGPLPYYRRQNNVQPATSIIEEVRTNSGSLIDCVTGCANQWGSSWPKREKRVRSLSIPANKDRVLGSGYTVLEEWLHDFHEEAVRGPGSQPAAPAAPRPTPVATPVPVATPRPTPAPVALGPTFDPNSYFYWYLEQLLGKGNF